MQLEKCLGFSVIFSLFILLISLSFLSFGQEYDSQSQFNQWYKTSARATGIKIEVGTSTYTKVSTNFSALNQLLLESSKSIVITIPAPNDTYIDVELIPSPVIAKGLAHKYPRLKTFSAQQVDQPNNKGRFDVTPKGFHGMLSYKSDMIFIEPSTDADLNEYVVYFRSKATNHLSTKVKQYAPKITIQSQDATENTRNTANKALAPNVTSLKTYRIAVSATAEYSEFHGGTKEGALAGIVTMLNRINQIFQRDLSITFELVEDNDKLIFLDRESDPFNNDDSDGDRNTAVIDSLIGNNNYDVGHVLSTGDGGLAVLGSACNKFEKANGVTGTAQPENDAFYIDYVAHELGHQFGANHSFNGTEDLCSGNRESSSAVEPGSGSSIMGYVGICGSQNLQENSDAYFNAHSIDEIKAFVNTYGSCGLNSSHLNNIPVVNAGRDHIIPANTPFTLQGSATDLDGDTLNYSWEQNDLGAASRSKQTQIDNGNRPLFRVFPPLSHAQRTFPQLESILNNVNIIGETYATTNRALNFRLLVRDNAGATEVDAIKIDVVDTGEAFQITTPIKGDRWTNASQDITWDVAGTNQAPINCNYVDINISEDGGENFNLLESNVVNDGQHTARLSDFNTSEARLKISCRDNIFFAINNGNFSVLVAEIPEIVGQKNIFISEGMAITLAPEMFYYEGIAADRLIVLPGDNYTFIGDKIIPANNYFGLIVINVMASQGGSELSQRFEAEVLVQERLDEEALPEKDRRSGSGVFYLFIFIILIKMARARGLNMTVFGGIKSKRQQS